MLRARLNFNFSLLGNKLFKTRLEKILIDTDRIITRILYRGKFEKLLKSSND